MVAGADAKGGLTFLSFTPGPGRQWIKIWETDDVNSHQIVSWAGLRNRKGTENKAVGKQAPPRGRVGAGVCVCVCMCVCG
jgi:hypothetical protein